MSNVLLILGLTLAELLYARGVYRLWRRAGSGHGVRYREAAAFVGGIAALVGALLSPLDALSAQLFSAHMIQHMILILIAAPLLLMGAAPVAFLWAVPRSWSRALGRRWGQANALRAVWHTLTRPLVSWALFVGMLWVWHLPALYQVALYSDTIHALEHTGYLIAALVFWWTLLKPNRQRHIAYGVNVLYLFTAMAQGGVLGALLTFSGRPWYPTYVGSVARWGLTAMDDQQLAGLIMWLPMGLLFTGLAVGYFAAWLRALEREMERRERQPILKGDLSDA